MAGFFKGPETRGAELLRGELLLNYNTVFGIDGRCTEG